MERDSVTLLLPQVEHFNFLTSIMIWIEDDFLSKIEEAAIKYSERNDD